QFLQNPGQISWINSPTPPNLRSYPIVRGIPYVFQVKHAEKPESNALSATVTAPIIPPDTSITMGAGNYNTTDGYWTATFTGCGQIGCVYQVKIAGQSEFGFIHPDLEHPLAAYPTAGGTGSFNNHNAAATPTGTTTIEVWVKQGTGAGGDGIFYNTGVTFTVTRGIPHNESVVNSSGGYYDNISGDGAGHSVILGGLTAGWYYNITDNSDNYISTWTSSSVINKTVTDTSITSLPSGTDVSTSTYKLYRSESSNGSSPTYTGVSYTRSLLNYSRLAFADATQSLDGTDTEFSVIVSNTISGHSYYIYSGNNIVNTPYPTAGNGGALTITVNETNIPNVNDQVTHILKTSSPVNGNTGEAYATGASYTVTRTGTDTETTTTTEGEYGLEIYAAGSETNKLYDTQSLTGRIMQSGRVPDSGTIPASEDADQEVLGMANTDDFVVVAVPQVSGSGSTGTEAAIDGHNFTLTKATDEFTIRNNGAVANYYHYFVIKNGGA
ncbi:MAG: hypothetical protein VYB55_04255, partial [Bacteroidota bacterium]|nr:hypothetical protein [Bacteroidota bacterium]